MPEKVINLVVLRSSEVPFLDVIRGRFPQNLRSKPESIEDEDLRGKFAILQQKLTSTVNEILEQISPNLDIEKTISLLEERIDTLKEDLEIINTWRDSREFVIAFTINSIYTYIFEEVINELQKKIAASE